MRILLILFLSLPCLAVAEIYRYTNENGEVVFSDKPVPGAQKQPVTSPTTVPSLKLPTAPLMEEAANGDTKIPAEFTRYQTLQILQPEHDTQVRNNVGTVEIVVKLEPNLVTKLGHHFQVSLDGKRLLNTWSEPTLVLRNIDRGTHSFKVFVVDGKGGNILMESQEQTFHLFRHSQLF